MRHRVEHFGDQRTDLLEFGDTETARRRRRRAEPQAGGDERLLGVERNAVLVASETGTDQRLLRDVALQTLRPQVDQHQMVIGAAGNNLEAVRTQRFRQRLGVLDDVLGVDLEIRLQRFLEGHRLRRDDVHQRAALQAGEDRRIQLLGDRLVVAQDQAAARTTERLVRGRGGDMGIGHRRGMHATGNQTGEMRHVHQKIRTDAVGDFAEALEVPRARIGRTTGDDQLRFHLLGLLGHRIHVDDLVFAPHRVVRSLEPLAGHVDRRTVGEMPARCEIKAHEGIAGLQQREKRGLVHLAAGVRLHIGEARTEQFLGAVDGKVLRHVDPLATAVITRARIAFRIFVGHYRALRLQHGAADDVFRGNQLDLMALATEFALDRGSDLRVGLAERRGEKRVGSGSGLGGRAHQEISPPPQPLGRGAGGPGERVG